MEEDKKCDRMVNIDMGHFESHEDRCPECGAHRVCGKKHDNIATEELCEKLFKERKENK